MPVAEQPSKPRVLRTNSLGQTLDAAAEASNHTAHYYRRKTSSFKKTGYKLIYKKKPA